MTSITQTIPNYVQGISEQPDELKAPGQLVNAVNVIPDITRGLMKRAGGKLLTGTNNPTTSDATNSGSWFSYYRSESERYIGKVFTDGTFKVWDCATGALQTCNRVNGADSDSYCNHSVEGDLQFLTINDYTYVTNRNKTVTTTATGGITPGWGNNLVEDGTTTTTYEHWAYIELKMTANARQYAFDLYKNDSGEYSESSVTRINATRATQDENGNAEDHTKNDSNSNYYDGSCPDIGTRLFNTGIDRCAYVATEASDCPSSGTSKTVRAWPMNGQSWPGGENLCFRLVVKGVSAPRGSNQDVGHGDDYTCTYTYDPTLLHGGEDWTAEDEFLVAVKSVRYKIKIREVQYRKIKATLGSTNGDGRVRPVPTAFDAEVAVSATSILGGMKRKVDKVIADSNFSGMTCEIIGNGIFIKANSAFNVGVRDHDLMNVVTGKINDVSKLPNACKHGTVIKILNSESETADDYFVMFKGNNGVDGPGSWEECALPGIHKRLDPATMPHAIVRGQNGQFYLTQIPSNSDTSNTTIDDSGGTDTTLPKWGERLVGDNANTNPKPKFARAGGTKIRKLLFWRNRFVALTNENAVLSQPGDFHNFWNHSALAVSPTDRIDIACSSQFPTNLDDGIVTNSGLILLSANQQFLLTTDSDLLTPDTAKISSLSTYNFNTKTQPISLGTSYAWLDDAGRYSRMFELTNVRREGEPTVLEQSKVISRDLQKGINRVANSRENNFVFLGVGNSFGTSGSRVIHGYKYFNSGEERLQAAWFRWRLHSALAYHTVMDDTYYAITEDGSFCAYPLTDSPEDLTLNQGEGIYETDYQIHLDNWVEVDHSAITYTANTDTSSFAVPTGINKDQKFYNSDTNSDALAAFDRNAGDNFGRYRVPTVNGSNLELKGDWRPGSGKKIIVGYNYEMKLIFPRFYVTQTQGQKSQADTRSSLVLQRLKLNLGNVGTYQTKLERTGKPDYTQLFEANLADQYVEGEAPFLYDKTETIPVYERNKNVRLYLYSKNPAPATVYSLTWEGDYTPMYYQRV